MFNVNKIRLGLGLLCLSSVVLADSGRAYLVRFQTYMNWSQNLPTKSDPEFLAFIESNTPLANRLRYRWLYQLAQNKNWVTYLQYYQGSKDINLQCYQLIAFYNQGKQQQAMQSAIPIWLAGHSQPPACNQLFNLLLKSPDLDEKLITKRITLALEESNLSLARHLLKQYKHPRLQDAETITDIYQHPTHITQLQPGELHGDFYLFGLKRLVAINIDKAIDYWNHVKSHQLLSEKQKQSFLTHLAIYKAMRNQPDTALWFAKIKPAYYTDVLLDWQIRYALKSQQWKKIEFLIKQSHDKENPCWQYWLGRALEGQGKKVESTEIYQKVAKIRNYYGFLASVRIHKKFSFENEYPVSDLRRLQPYQPFTDQIKALYLSNQTLQASRLLNDFLLELPKEDKSALVYWLAHELKWHGKAVYLSSSDEELGNQLALRFPLAYHQSVTHYAKNYNVSQQLIYAIIRQESTFREDVVSSAGAHGLMQVMPATAQAIAKNSHIDYVDKKQLFLPPKNINIGAAYLQQLAKRFSNHPVLIAAAYNAGPRQVVYWLKNHPVKPIDIWIETLPWYETRNYIKNVIAFYAVYQYRMQEKPDLSAFMKPF